MRNFICRKFSLELKQFVILRKWKVLCVPFSNWLLLWFLQCQQLLLRHVSFRADVILNLTTYMKQTRKFLFQKKKVHCYVLWCVLILHHASQFLTTLRTRYANTSHVCLLTNMCLECSKMAGFTTIVSIFKHLFSVNMTIHLWTYEFVFIGKNVISYAKKIF